MRLSCWWARRRLEDLCIFVLSTWLPRLSIKRSAMNFALETPDRGSRVAGSRVDESRVWSPTHRKVFKSWSSNADFMWSLHFWVSLFFFLNAGLNWASRFSHWTRISYEPRVWASTFICFKSFSFSYTNCCVFPFAVWYSSNSLSKKCHFGHIGGADPNMIFVLQKTAIVIADKSRERRSRVSSANMLTLWEIIWDGRLESDSRAPLRKPDFFFGDSIEEDEVVLYDGDYKWLRNRRFFLPNMERMYPLAYLQHMSVRRTMDWELVKPISGGYFRLSVYAWVFSSHIYVADSRRDSIFTYYEKRGVTGPIQFSMKESTPLTVYNNLGYKLFQR